ncbi:MAG: polysaccharide deacetylase [Pseudolabrys sp.]|jgi:peptidoglycan/xylan/chitin deacetylase (PgdA/CDA1 family)|nr:polysaccharide deacetylase [Pseudolabrys sp.]
MVLQRKLYCVFALVVCAFGCVMGTGAMAADAAPPSCPGNPDALGVSRVIKVGPDEYARLGLMQYRHTLPLNDHEVVLTFDDGPLPPYTTRVLAALSHECVKATFFMVGRMAAAYPKEVRLVASMGHTIGSHSQNHPLHFNALSEAAAERELVTGMQSVKTALAGDGALAPFFRVPGLGRTKAFEKFAQSDGVVVWSADTVADDWTPISASQVVHRAVSRLEAKGKGILLLHDIQARTALALPVLLRELKAHGFKIVQVVPDGVAPVPKPGEPGVMVASAPAKPAWPRVFANETEMLSALAKQQADARAAYLIGLARSHGDRKSGRRVHTATLAKGAHRGTVQ